jgi:hypothetical protein
LESILSLVQRLQHCFGSLSSEVDLFVFVARLDLSLQFQGVIILSLLFGYAMLLNGCRMEFGNAKKPTIECLFRVFGVAETAVGKTSELIQLVVENSGVSGIWQLLGAFDYLRNLP